MNAFRARVIRRALPVLCLALALGGATWDGPAAAQSFARQIQPPSGVFALVTMDRINWNPYEYGTGFFFDAAGDAYTASSIVRDALKDPYLVLVALVGEAEYAVHVTCWNPSATSGNKTASRDVAVVHVGPDVPEFPLWSYHPATSPLAAHPMPLVFGEMLAQDENVRIVGFGHRQQNRLPQEEAAGLLRSLGHAADGAEIVTIGFPTGGGPAYGAGGAPIVDDAGGVIGIAVWRGTHPNEVGAVDALGVASSSLGCVSRLPSKQAPPSPIPAPIRPL
jgi:hypothetical protein